MKLQLVGTGAIGVKERSACSLIDGKILIDCGNGNVKTLMEQGVDLKEIEAIFITHLHADHFFDLPFYVLTRAFIQPNQVTKIFCPKGTETIVKNLFDDYLADGINFNTLKEKGKIEFVQFDHLEKLEFITDYYVTSYPVKHGNLNVAYGYVIKNQNNSIGFSGDSVYCESIDKIVGDSDLTVLDMSFPERNNMHMGVDDVEIICNKFNDKKIVSTHMSNQSRKLAIEKNITNLVVPDDGDIVYI